MSHKIFFRFSSLILALVITFAGYSPALAAPPANDNFADAEVIASLPFSASPNVTESTAELNEPKNCTTILSQTVWYSFTPTETMSVRVDALGSAIPSFIDIFHATGSGITNLQHLGCSFGNTSNFLAEAGQIYYFQVGTSFGGIGTVQINLQQIFPPANDLFANAEAITSLPFTATVDITDTTIESSEPQQCFPQQTVWYSFTPSQTMSVRADTLGGAINGTLGIYHATGSGISNLQQVKCIFSGSSTFLAEAGQTYYVQASPNGGIGTIQINLQQVFPPANDLFGNAEVISSLPFSSTLDITDTGVEPGEPGCFFQPQQTVWYSFTPAQSMSVRVDTLGGLFSSIVLIYHATGSGISNLQPMNCLAGNPSTFLAEAGQTYYLQVSPNGGSSTIQINLQQVFPPANDFFSNAQAITSLPFTATVDTTDTGNELGEPNNCGSARTVWYSFTPAQTMSVRVDTSGGTVDGTVDIFKSTGSGFANLQHLSCTGGFGSSSTFLAEAGQTYYLQANSLNGGTIQVNLQQVFPPANDLFANPEVISALPFTATVDITDTSVEPGEPNSCFFSAQRTVWYSFTPVQTMSVRVNVLGGTVNGTVDIFRATGSGFANLQHLVCAGGFGSSSTFLAEAGKTYYLQVSPIFGGSGTVQLNLQQFFPPANDDFANAQAITLLPFSATPDISDAVIERGEPQFCLFIPRTVWYSFTPTTGMEVRVNAQGGSINGNINIYRATGSGLSGLQFQQCIGPFDSPTFLAEAGQTYYLQVGAENGTVALNLERVSPPTMEVAIDIKPGDRRNRIEIESDEEEDDEKISVAILSTEQFDAPQQVDKRSLTFGATGDENSLNLKGRGRTPDCRIKDVNRDKLSDLVCKYKLQSTGFQLGDTEGILKGLTVEGLPIEGHDSVVIKMDD